MMRPCSIKKIECTDSSKDVSKRPKRSLSGFLKQKVTIQLSPNGFSLLFMLFLYWKWVRSFGRLLALVLRQTMVIITFQIFPPFLASSALQGLQSSWQSRHLHPVGQRSCKGLNCLELGKPSHWKSENTHTHTMFLYIALSFGCSLWHLILILYSLFLFETHGLRSFGVPTGPLPLCQETKVLLRLGVVGVEQRKVAVDHRQGEWIHLRKLQSQK